MVLGCAFMVFSGVIVLVYLREVGFALPPSLSLAVWWWLGCGWVEGGGVGGVFLSGEGCWELSF